MNISGIKDIAQMQSMVLNDDLFVLRTFAGFINHSNRNV
jgi:hypothetical protein